MQINQLKKGPNMCNNGVDTSGFKTNMEQYGETAALLRRWTHRSFHQAEWEGASGTMEKLRKAQDLLDDVRALYEEASELIDKELKDTLSSVKLV
ncbi:MAG: hypothetical protein LBH87_02370 [Coriobacteriales bacterium]|nr:hypothetical protein [Coriobacteriales bacterium]